MNVERTKRWLILFVSLVTGAAVSISGMIGFVGLIVPASCGSWSDPTTGGFARERTRRRLLPSWLTWRAPCSPRSNCARASSRL